MSGLSDSHAEWFTARKLCIETAAEMGANSRGPGIAFNYTIAGKLLYAKVRDPRDKKFTKCVPSGVEQIHLWNQDCLQDEPQPGDSLIITEGEPDAIAVKQLGYQFVVSLPSGAASTLEGCRSKARKCLTIDVDGELTLKPDVAKFKRVIILADGDADGLHMRQAVMEIIGEEYCWLPTYPDSTKDANDVLVEHGSEGLRNMIENARPAKDDGFIDFMSAETIVSPLKPLPCGIPFLEPHFRPVKPSFIVIGGQAGHGKSTITQAILFNLLYANEGLRASIFHAEGDKTIPIQRAKKFWKGKANPLHMSPDKLAERNAWIGDRLAFIAPPQGQAPTFEWLVWAMERQALYRKRNVFVIDPWNQIMLKLPRSGSKTDYIGECIYEMKRLGERYGLIIIVAHHTTKAMDPRTPPSRYDLADSAHWVNAADHLMLGWKPDESENVTRLEIAKSKDHDKMGAPGHVWVGLDAPTFSIQAKIAPRGHDRKSGDEKGAKDAVAGDPGAQPPPKSLLPDPAPADDMPLIADVPDAIH